MAQHIIGKHLEGSDTVKRTQKIPKISESDGLREPTKMLTKTNFAVVDEVKETEYFSVRSLSATILRADS